MGECSVIVKPWSELTTDELFDFLKLRTEVFFLEQRIDEEELDEHDRSSATLHMWIPDASGTAAYLRVIETDEPEHLAARRLLGRVVVRADRRGEGLAQRLIDVVIARFGHEPLLLHAQQYIVPLYAKYGFATVGEVYLEAGLPHIAMYRPGSP